MQLLGIVLAFIVGVLWLTVLPSIGVLWCFGVLV